jgi:hypothetical protein
VAANDETFGDGSYYTTFDSTTGEPEEPPTTFNGLTAGDTLAVFSVDMEDLLFDGDLDVTDPNKKETRTFTLDVAETGKESRTYTVNLNITLDPDTETSIYHRTGTPGAYHYEKVRDAALTDDDKTNYALPEENNPADFRAYTKGPVTDLQNALVWVDHHGEGEEVLGNGAPVGYANGTTEGYSEYRLFLKQDQAIGKIVLSFLNQRGTYNGPAITELDRRDRMSIQLYGAGTPGGAEKKITSGLASYTDATKDTLNYGYSEAVGYGLISLSRAQGGGVKPNPINGLKYKALVLGKNITIDGEGQANPVTNNNANSWSRNQVKNFLCIGDNSTVIMENDSKITGCHTTENDYELAPVLIKEATGRFYMKGGTITGNTFHLSDAPGVIVTGETIFDQAVALQCVHVDTQKASITGNTPTGANALFSLYEWSAWASY